MSPVVAVTGSEGFVGRYVVADLARSPGIDIVRLVRGRSAIGRHLNTRVVQVDVLTAAGRRELARVQPDVLIHLAWNCLSDFRSSRHLDQVPDHLSLLESLIEAGVQRIVGAGTCLEYGLVEGELEECTPLTPVIAYGEAKARLFEELQQLAVGAGVSWCWARIFYPYGPGQRRNSLWGGLHAAIDRGDLEFPMSGGEQVRDYIRVSEVGRALSRLAQSNAIVGPANVCTGKPVTVRELVESWIIARGARIRPVFGALPYPDYEPMAFWGSPRVLGTLLQGDPSEEIPGAQGCGD